MSFFTITPVFAHGAHCHIKGADGKLTDLKDAKDEKTCKEKNGIWKHHHAHCHTADTNTDIKDVSDQKACVASGENGKTTGITDSRNKDFRYESRHNEEVTDHRVASIQRALAFAGALLFTLGLFTGIWSGMALNGSVVLKLPRMALSAHLNALFGGLWCLAVAYTFDFLRYDAKQLRRLSWLVSVPSWANWFITLVASALGVNGLTYNGSRANDAVALGLQAFVVLPSLASSLYWLRGFVSGTSSPSSLKSP